jgi:hypothetical protein
MLRSHATQTEIATDLGETERRDLGLALQQALHRLRSPVFDNAVLRDAK